MSANRTNNQDGLTLIELLVTMTISTMVLGLLVSILLSTFNHSQQSQAHINLRQEGNYLVTQLKQAHSQGDYTLCYKDDKLHIKGKPIETLASEGVNIKGMGNEGVMFAQGGLQLSSEGSATCDDPLNVVKNQELSVTVTLTDNYDREFNIETVIERLGNLVISVDEDNGEDNSTIPYDQLFLIGNSLNFQGNELNGPGGSILINGNLPSNNINGGAKINVSNIYINGDFAIASYGGNIGTEDPPGKIVVNGNFELGGGSAPIYGDIYVSGDANFSGSSSFITHGKINIIGDANMTNGRFREVVNIGGNLSLKDATLDADVFVDGDVAIGWTPKFNNDAKVYYTGKLTHPNSLNTEKFIKKSAVPAVESQSIPQNEVPTLRDDQWFKNNNYSTKIEKDGMRLFQKNGNVTISADYNNNLVDFTDAIVVSHSGDILIDGGALTMNGILIAPNGSVNFNAASFEGMIISKYGFRSKGGSSVTFRPLLDFINGPDEFPFKNKD